MQTASSPALLESMALQHKAYLSQIDRLHAKSQLFELMDRNNKTTVTISRATQTDGMHSVEASKQLALDEDTVYQTLRENDLLNRACLKTSEKPDHNQASVTSSKSGNPSDIDALGTFSSDKSPSTSEVIKPDGVATGDGLVSVDELVRMNEKLSQAVCGLLQELEVMKAEKKQIEEKLWESQEVLKQGSEALTFSSLDLPPLELSFPELANINIQT